MIEQAIAWMGVFSVALAAATTFVFFKPSKTSTFKCIGMDPGFLGWRSKAAAKQYETVGWQMAQSQYQQDKNISFRIPVVGRIILSPKYIEELWKVPEDELSHRHSFAERFMGSTTGMDVVLQSRLHSDLIRVQLTQSLEGLLPFMMKELAGLKLENTWLRSKTFQPTKVFELASDLISCQTSRVLVGESLCHNAEWVTVSRGYLNVLLDIMKTLKAWPAMARPWVAPWLASVKKLDEFDGKLFAWVGPQILERRQNPSKRVPSMLDLLVDRCKGAEATTQSIVKKLMMINVAASSTSTLALSNAIIDLCAMPHYIGPLQAEVSQAMKNNGGKLDLATIQSMWRLDSFLKESHRVNQPGLFGFIRKVRAPMILSDGKSIGPGETISLPTGFMAHDPEVFEGGYDGWRFYRQRISKDNKNHPETECEGNSDVPNAELGGNDLPDADLKDSSRQPDAELQFTGVLPTMPVWGLGRSTCPGRFYAGLQIKLALILLLQDCEFCFPAGQTERPAGIVRGEFILPPTEQDILLRQTQKGK